MPAPRLIRRALAPCKRLRLHVSGLFRLHLPPAALAFKGFVNDASFVFALGVVDPQGGYVECYRVPGLLVGGPGIFPTRSMR